MFEVVVGSVILVAVVLFWKTKTKKTESVVPTHATLPPTMPDVIVNDVEQKAVVFIPQLSVLEPTVQIPVTKIKAAKPLPKKTAKKAPTKPAVKKRK